MENVVIACVAILVVAMPMWGRIVGRHLIGPAPVRLQGLLGPADEWLPRVAHKARPVLSGLSWHATSGELLDEYGDLVGYHATVSGGLHTITARLPAYQFEREYTRDEPLVALVEMTEYGYRSALIYRLMLGKYPNPGAIRARASMIRQLKKQARWSARRLQRTQA